MDLSNTNQRAGGNPMRSYIISRRHEEFSWDKVPTLQVDNHQWLEPAPISVQAQICYDDSALYVKMAAVEPNIRAEGKCETDFPHLDSCLEFFFCPIPGNKQYINVEFNPNGCMFFGLGFPGNAAIRMLPERELLDIKTQRTDDGWFVTYQIPYDLIRHIFPDFRAQSGMKIRANCYKCGFETVQQHYITWNKVELPNPSFHCPDHFGEMIFE